LLDGIELADSLATDAHKWLNVPYDSGLVFVRERRALNAAMSASAAYLVEGETRDPHLFVPEMSGAPAASRSGPLCARWGPTAWQR
jgi:glutamate/tyrosine decarboxylase-like PLP-dependent enzyme